MRPPLCAFETKTCEYRDYRGRWQFDAISTPAPCAHVEGHWYDDFNDKLKRLHPDLNFGFDRRKNRFVIFRYTPCVERLGKGSQFSYIHRFIDIVLECKQWQEYEWKGSIQRRIIPRKPGEWVFHELATSSPDRFQPNNHWGEKEATKIAKAADAKADEQVREAAEDFVDDMISVADRGDLTQKRIAVRVKEGAAA